MLKNIIYIFSLLLLASCTKSTNTSSIKVVGEMRDVMWKGDLKGKIATDSLNYKETYGLGPIEVLKGEIVVFEGQTFVSKVIDSVSHQVTKIPSVRAPFFVYSTNSDLKVVEFNRENFTLKELEEYINSVYKDYDRVDAWFRRLDVTPKIYAQVAGNEAIVSMVSLGLGLGVVPKIVLDNSPHAERVRVLEVDPVLEPYELGLFTLKRHLHNPLVDAFWSLLPDEVDQ